MPDKRDAFPRTQRTWINGKLASGDTGLNEVRRHIMDVYPDPLCEFLENRKRLEREDAEDAVQGFLASRLARKDYFKKWQEKWEENGMPLRWWLLSGLEYFLGEELKQERRAYKTLRPSSPTDARTLSSSWTAQDVTEEFDRAVGVSIVRVALNRAREICESTGLLPRWRIFCEHFLEGRPYKECAPPEGLDAREAERRMQPLKELVGWELRCLLVCDINDAMAFDQAHKDLLLCLERPRKRILARPRRSNTFDYDKREVAHIFSLARYAQGPVDDLVGCLREAKDKGDCLASLFKDSKVISLAEIASKIAAGKTILTDARELYSRTEILLNAPGCLFEDRQACLFVLLMATAAAWVDCEIWISDLKREEMRSMWLKLKSALPSPWADLLVKALPKRLKKN